MWANNERQHLIFHCDTWSVYNCISDQERQKETGCFMLSTLTFLIPGWDPRRKQVCPDRPRRKLPMSRPSRTEVAYVQTVPDGKCLCPDRPRRKMPMSRPSQMEVACVQTFVRTPDFRAFDRLSRVRQTFVRSCSDFRAFFDVSRLCNFERTTPPSFVHLRSEYTWVPLGPQPGIAFEKWCY